MYVAATEPEKIGLPHVHSILCVQRTVGKADKPDEVGQRWFVCSLSVEEIGNGRRILERIVGHWDVENRNHWLRDAQWGEDSTRMRTPKLVRNMALLRGAALSVSKSYNGSLPELFMKCQQRPTEALKMINSNKLGLN